MLIMCNAVTTVNCYHIMNQCNGVHVFSMFFFSISYSFSYFSAIVTVNASNTPVTLLTVRFDMGAFCMVKNIGLHTQEKTAQDKLKRFRLLLDKSFL